CDRDRTRLRRARVPHCLQHERRRRSDRLSHPSARAGWTLVPLASRVMQIRALTTFDECRQVVALEKDVWGYTDAEDVVPAPVLIVGVKRGAILLGAFDAAGAMKGFVYSIPAIKDGRLTQWSHMLGVSHDARGWGIGRQLKLAQRDRARAMDI